METSKELIKIQLNGKDALSVLISCIVTGFLLKIPQWFSIGMDESSFYLKFGGWIVILGVSLYILLKGGVTAWSNRIVACFSFLIPGLFMYFLTPATESSTFYLTYIHMPILMGGFYGLIYIDFDYFNRAKRIEFIRYLGDLLTIGAIIILSGGLLAFISIALFQTIGIRISDIYMNYIAVWGLGVTPILATFIVHNVPVLKNKLAPIVALLFSPLALITLIVFLFSIPQSDISLYNDRSFLLIFNLMLLGVMALIVYSISDFTTGKKSKYKEIILLLLTTVALLIDVYALAAIGYRIASFGITANKMAVLGSNLIFFAQLLFILITIVRSLRGKVTTQHILETVANFLPVYFAWVLLVTFTFPILFGMH